MKERLEYIWCYYKWYILATVLLAALTLDFVGQKRSVTLPDASIAIVSSSLLRDSRAEELSDRLSEYTEDRNGDGKQYVAVNLCKFGGETETAEDAAERIAGSVHLAEDLNNEVSCCYVTDCPELLCSERPELVSIGKAEKFPVLSGFAELTGFTVLSREKDAVTALELLNNPADIYRRGKEWSE